MAISVRTIVLTLAALLVIGAALFFYFGSGTGPQSCAEKTPQPRIVAFGDSLVAGQGATTEGGFVSLISQKIALPITNLGKNGDTTAQAKERLESVSAAQPNITLVLLGGNDTLRRIPVTDTEKNLREIIEAIQKTGSRVVLIGVIGGFPRDPYAPMFERLSKEYDLTYVPNVLSGIIGRSDLMSDSVHPNQEGYQKIADRIAATLEKECSR